MNENMIDKTTKNFLRKYAFSKVEELTSLSGLNFLIFASLNIELSTKKVKEKIIKKINIAVCRNLALIFGIFFAIPHMMRIISSFNQEFVHHKIIYASSHHAFVRVIRCADYRLSSDVERCIY